MKPQTWREEDPSNKFFFLLPIILAEEFKVAKVRIKHKRALSFAASYQIYIKFWALKNSIGD